MDITLPTEWERFIDQKVKAGQYASEAAVINEGLRLLREKEAYTAWLKKEIAIGVEQADRGEVAPLDMKEILAEAYERLAEHKEAS